MKRILLYTTAFFVAAPASAQQLSPNCPAGTAQDACQKAVDLFRYMAPQLSTSLAGGNAVLGWSGSLGGFGHFSLGVRASGVMGTVPEVTKITPSTSGAQRSTYETKDQLLGVPTADIALGVVPRFDFGPIAMTGLDLLVSAQYLRNINAETFSVEVPGGSTKFGFGGRLGFRLEAGALPLPEIGISYLQRDLPTLNLLASVNQDQLSVRDLEVGTRAWRLTVGQRLGPFGLVLGAGRDSYETNADITATVAARTGPPATPAASAGPIAVDQELSRTNLFADLSFGLKFFQIVAEIGRVTGGSVETFNQFPGTPADEARTFGAVGLTFGF